MESIVVVSARTQAARDEVARLRAEFVAMQQTGQSVSIEMSKGLRAAEAELRNLTRSEDLANRAATALAKSEAVLAGSYTDLAKATAASTRANAQNLASIESLSSAQTVASNRNSTDIRRENAERLEAIRIRREETALIEASIKAQLVAGSITPAQAREKISDRQQQILFPRGAMATSTTAVTTAEQTAAIQKLTSIQEQELAEQAALSKEQVLIRDRTREEEYRSGQISLAQLREYWQQRLAVEELGTKEYSAISNRIRSISAELHSSSNAAEERFVEEQHASHVISNKELQDYWAERLQIETIGSAEYTRVANKMRSAEAATTAERMALVSDPIAAKQRFATQSRNVGTAFRSIGDSLTNNVTVPILGAAAAGIYSSVERESANAGFEKLIQPTAAQSSDPAKMAEYTKQVDGVKSALADLTKVLPLTYKELADLAMFGTQRGIPTDQLGKFVKVVAELGLVTDVSGKQAAEGIAKIIAATGAENTAENYERIGNALAASQKFGAATGGEVLKMSERFAAVGKNANLSLADIIAVSHAVGSMGQQAEAGGGALIRVFNAISVQVATNGKHLKQYAEIAGMTVPQFSKLYKTDALAAVMAFSAGLGTLNQHQISSSALMQEMGIKSVNQTILLSNLSRNQALVATSRREINDAFNHGNQLQQASNVVTATTGSQIKILGNQAFMAAADFGDKLAPALREMLPTFKSILDDVEKGITAFSKLSPEMQKTIIYAIGIAAATGPLLSVLGNTFLMVGNITRGLAALEGLRAGATFAEIGAGAVTAEAGATGFSASIAGFAAVGGGVLAVLAEVAVAWVLIKRDIDAAKDAADNFQNAKEGNQKTDTGYKTLANSSDPRKASAGRLGQIALTRAKVLEEMHQLKTGTAIDGEDINKAGAGDIRPSQFAGMRGLDEITQNNNYLRQQGQANNPNLKYQFDMQRSMQERYNALQKSKDALDASYNAEKKKNDSNYYSNSKHSDEANNFTKSTPDYVKAMMADNTRVIGKECGEAITKYLNQTGHSGSASTLDVAANRVTPDKAGNYPEGTIFRVGKNFHDGRGSGGENAYSRGHYEILHYGRSGPTTVEANYGIKLGVTDSRPFNEKREASEATWGGAVHAYLPSSAVAAAWNRTHSNAQTGPATPAPGSPNPLATYNPADFAGGGDSKAKKAAEDAAKAQAEKSEGSIKNLQDELTDVLDELDKKVLTPELIKRTRAAATRLYDQLQNAQNSKALADRKEAYARDPDNKLAANQNYSNALADSQREHDKKLSDLNDKLLGTEREQAISKIDLKISAANLHMIQLGENAKHYEKNMVDAGDSTNHWYKALQNARQASFELEVGKMGANGKRTGGTIGLEEEKQDAQSPLKHADHELEAQTKIAQATAKFNSERIADETQWHNILAAGIGLRREALDQERELVQAQASNARSLDDRYDFENKIYDLDKKRIGLELEQTLNQNKSIKDLAARKLADDRAISKAKTDIEVLNQHQASVNYSYSQDTESQNAELYRAQSSAAEDLARKVELVTQAQKIEMQAALESGDARRVAILQIQQEREALQLLADAKVRDAQNFIIQGQLSKNGNASEITNVGLDKLKGLTNSDDASTRSEGLNAYLNELQDLAPKKALERLQQLEQDMNSAGTLDPQAFSSIQKLAVEALNKQIEPVIHSTEGMSKADRKKVLDKLVESFSAIAKAFGKDAVLDLNTTVNRGRDSSDPNKNKGVPSDRVPPEPTRKQTNDKRIEEASQDFINTLISGASNASGQFVQNLLNPKTRKNAYKEFWASLSQAGENAIGGVINKVVNNALSHLLQPVEDSLSKLFSQLNTNSLATASAIFGIYNIASQKNKKKKAGGILGGILGAVGGFALGGPAGAEEGFGIGSAVGTSLFDDPRNDRAAREASAATIKSAWDFGRETARGAAQSSRGAVMANMGNLGLNAGTESIANPAFVAAATQSFDFNKIAMPDINVTHIHNDSNSRQLSQLSEAIRSQQIGDDGGSGGKGDININQTFHGAIHKDVDMDRANRNLARRLETLKRN